MKRIFVFALLFAVAGSVFAQSKFGVNGQIRPRFQFDDKDFNAETGANTFTELRTRVGISFSPFENLEGFAQLQDSRVFGTEPNTLTSAANLDLHQGYFKINKLFNLPLNLKIGRMELSYGSQRLIGAVGWHNVGRSFDGTVLKLLAESFSVDLIAVRTNETGLKADSSDAFLYSAYGNVGLPAKHVLQPFIIAEFKVYEDFSRYTLGFYLGNGKGSGFRHELEAAYQTGSQTTDVDIAAFMAAYNVNYTFDVKTKPSIGAGIDYLSGDDGTDATKYKTFNTLYATNHKFYGYMDYFLNIPKHTYGLGLMDLQGRISFSPFAKFKAAAAYHVFNSTVDYTLAGGGTSSSFGSEMDLTLSYKYNEKVNFIGGFSFFTPGDIFKEKRGTDTSIWSYLMAVVNL